ncbi:MAG TPA: exonuclease SbcCD subunit D [Candidatus Dormibacteraeota bacterium]|jgi:exonuclease SbcD|nr:exonuclease SbcCD subunit D [Candidatus Dormibacteraeota bacterium]
MKLLHTADWHVGRSLMNVSRQPDIEAAVERILTIAREQRPDLIVHAGDLFDAIRPSTQDMHWAIDRLQELGAIAPTYVVCGNHDSPSLFELFNKLLGPASPVHFIPCALPPSRGGIIELECADRTLARLAPLPFVPAGRMVPDMEDPSSWMTGYADRVDRLIRALEAGLTRGYDPGRHVLLLAAHLFVTGSRFSRSERPITVTDAYASRAENLPAVSYAAYGHIHRPQALPGAGQGRYAGSVVPLDFGERDERKEVVVVEARPGLPAEVEIHPLDAGRPLRRLEGSLEELTRIAPGIGEALCLIVVRSERPTPDLGDRIAELMPEATLLDVFEDCSEQRLASLTEADVAEEGATGFAELFHDYLAESGVRSGSADRILRTFESLITAIENEEPPALAETAS